MLGGTTRRNIFLLPTLSCLDFKFLKINECDKEIEFYAKKKCLMKKKSPQIN